MAISNDEILSVALDLFSQNGYEGTSLRDLADCLKVTKGALFKHYDSKDELWNALIDKVEGYYGENFGKVSQITLPDTLEELQEMTRHQVNFTLNDETIIKVRKLLTLGQFRNERMKALATRHFSGDIEAMYTDVFRHLMDIGQIKGADVSFLTISYTAPITELIHTCDREPEMRETAISKIEEFVRGFIEIYGNNNPTDGNTAKTVAGM